LQDSAINTSSGKKNTLQLSFDIQTLGNLLYCGWGGRQLIGNNRLSEAAYTTATPDVPTHTLRGGNQTFYIDPSLASRWRAQVGMH
jgi:hypothetical protein